MTNKTRWSNIRITVLILLILIFAFSLLAQDSNNWQIVVEQELAVDEAIKVATEDLKKTGPTLPQFHQRVQV